MAAGYCMSCGAEIPPGERYCGNCGRAVDGPLQGSMGAVRSTAGDTSGKAIASLVLGLLGLFAIPVIGSVLAIVLGGQAKREIAAEPRLGGEGLASAGVILGWVGVGLVMFGLLLFLL